MTVDDVVLERQDQVDDGLPLGRHVRHDPRSRAFRITGAGQVVRRPVLWRPRTRPLDQSGPLTFRRRLYPDGLGACTGMAAAKALSCELPGAARGRRLLEPSALRFYSRATELDPWQGRWPDEDTGSSGLAVAQTCLELGLIVRYEHGFGIGDVLDGLQHGALITGTWWTEGMDRPNGDGMVRPTGYDRGGHEYTINGWDGDASPAGVLSFLQSWGAWGLPGGVFRMTVGDYAGLLERHGDVTRLIAA